jgi:hypothetical protein
VPKIFARIGSSMGFLYFSVLGRAAPCAAVDIGAVRMS